MTNNAINTLMIVIQLFVVGGYATVAVRLTQQVQDLTNKYGVTEFESRRQRAQIQARAALIQGLGVLILLPSVLSVLLGWAFMATMKPD